MGTARSSGQLFTVVSTSIEVPYTYYHSYLFCYYLSLLIALSFLSLFTQAQQYNNRLESSYNYDYSLYATSTEHSPEELSELNIGTQVEHYAEPTPPIDSNQLRTHQLAHEFGSQKAETTNHKIKEMEPLTFFLDDDRYSDSYISPAKVLKQNLFLDSENNIFSPIFNLQMLEESNRLSTNYPLLRKSDNSIVPQQNFQADNSGGADFAETGSGNGWDSHMLFDDISNIMEDSTSINEYDSPATMLPTPVLSPTFSQATIFNDEKSNRAPVVNHRLPKLSVAAGSAWRYFIPQDTFLDEDGDLKQLKTSVYFKRYSNAGAIGLSVINSNESGLDIRETVDQYFSWVQYDQTSLLLYGFSTDSILGKHELILEVSDRWGAVTYETLEINVKQHQSSRAFTHLFSFNQISWNQQRFPSIVEALIEITKRIGHRVYTDNSTKNIIVRGYVIKRNGSVSTNIQEESNLVSAGQYSLEHTTVSISLTWSNNSVPVHPCDLSLIEDLTRPLIETRSVANNSILLEEKVELTPSTLVLESFGSNFRISNISVGLQGSCEGKTSMHSISNNQESTTLLLAPRVRVKIGKLTWKLGELIEFKIPEDIFGNDNVTSLTRDLYLTLHTIDGKTLDKDIKYSYLEFDAENQVIFGLSYDLSNHVGQRELQLTAKHPNHSAKIREVFIINIEPQELTTINNRAFSMALYMLSRTVTFGPRERVMLSHKIIEASRSNYNNNMQDSEFVVIEVQKFTTRYQSLNNTISSSSSGIVRVVDYTYNSDEEFSSFHDSSLQKNFLYKFIWTNKTIGYHGDCPVEVIKENVLYALEQSMLELKLPEEILNEDSYKNDTARFYDRLRLYFEPEIELIHLRFEPLSACRSALEPLDVGNGDIADLADKVGNLPLDIYPEVSTPYTISTTPKLDTEPDPDEYWSIVVLIILVMALIFVVIMFFMGMHTYKINQDKRFELQVRLAQARQNSMYLSSMVLANHATSNDIYSQVLTPAAPKSLFVVQEEEKGSREPVILENEKHFLADSQRYDLKSTAVQLGDHGIHTLPLEPNMTFALDSGQWHPSVSTLNHNQNYSRITPISQDDNQRSVTLGRKSIGSIQQFPFTSYAPINHSQSILTVASFAAPIPLMPQGGLPVVPIYNHYPVSGEYRDQQQLKTQDFPSLKRRFSQQKLNIASKHKNPSNKVNYHPSPGTNTLFAETASKGYTQNILDNGVSNIPPYGKIRSPSYSSSASATTQSVISNPNYAPNSQAT